MVFAPASLGEIGIAPRRASLLTTLKPGEVRVQTEGGEELLFWVGAGLWKCSRTRSRCWPILRRS